MGRTQVPILAPIEAAMDDVGLWAAYQNGDDWPDVVPVKHTRYQIRHNVGRLPPQFHTMITYARPAHEEEFSISLPETVQQTVTYTEQDRIRSGPFLEKIKAEMRKLGYSDVNKGILVFILPENDRGAEYVIYYEASVRMVD